MLDDVKIGRGMAGTTGNSQDVGHGNRVDCMLTANLSYEYAKKQIWAESSLCPNQI
jgi:hypothetical protein